MDVLTEEQTKIRDAISDISRDLQKDVRKVILIKSGAGVGKTRVLKEAAQACKIGVRILYLAYNVSAKKDAEDRMSTNANVQFTDARTIHSMAFKYSITNMNMLFEAAEWMFEKAVKKYVEDNGKFRLSHRQIMETLANYCHSEDDTIEDHHISVDAKPRFRPLVYEMAKEIWLKMCNREFVMSHDHYMKYAQLHDRSMATIYDICMVDEGQDMIPCTKAYICAQTFPCLVVVGDPMQQINAFNGAISSLDRFHEPDVFNLSKTFRFSQHWAKFVNYVMDMLEVDYVPLDGNPDRETKIVDSIQSFQPYVVLCRTNMQIIRELQRISMTNLKARYNDNIQVTHYRINEAQKKVIKELRSFVKIQKEDPWGQRLNVMMRSAAARKDMLKQSMIDFVLQNPDAERILNVIETGVADEDVEVDVDFRTVHNAKGTTLPYVRLAGDLDVRFCSYFMAKMGEQIPAERPAYDECCVLYVALTRVSEAIELTDVFKLLYNHFLATLGGQACKRQKIN